MIKLFSHKCLSLALTVLVLFTTVSLTVEKHFCGDNLIDFSLFSPAEKCGMAIEPSSLNHESVEKSCCKDVIEVISAQSQLDTNSKNSFSEFQKQFAAVFVYSYAGLFSDYSDSHTSFITYAEPALVYDLNLLEQVFLI
jgi:hypothetical protein